MVDLSARFLIDLGEWENGEEIVPDDEDEEEEDFQSFFLVRFLLELFFTFLTVSCWLVELLVPGSLALTLLLLFSSQLLSPRKNVKKETLFTSFFLQSFSCFLFSFLSLSLSANWLRKRERERKDFHPPIELQPGQISASQLVLGPSLRSSVRTLCACAKSP